MAISYYSSVALWQYPTIEKLYGGNVLLYYCGTMDIHIYCSVILWHCPTIILLLCGNVLLVLR